MESFSSDRREWYPDSLEAKDLKQDHPPTLPFSLSLSHTHWVLSPPSTHISTRTFSSVFSVGRLHCSGAPAAQTPTSHRRLFSLPSSRRINYNYSLHTLSQQFLPAAALHLSNSILREGRRGSPDMHHNTISLHQEGLREITASLKNDN